MPKESTIGSTVNLSSPDTTPPSVKDNQTGAPPSIPEELTPSAKEETADARSEVTAPIRPEFEGTVAEAPESEEPEWLRKLLETTNQTIEYLEPKVSLEPGQEVQTLDTHSLNQAYGKASSVFESIDAVLKMVESDDNLSSLKLPLGAAQRAAEGSRDTLLNREKSVHTSEGIAKSFAVASGRLEWASRDLGAIMGDEYKEAREALEERMKEEQEAEKLKEQEEAAKLAGFQEEEEKRKRHPHLHPAHQKLHNFKGELRGMVEAALGSPPAPSYNHGPQHPEIRHPQV